MKKSVRVEKVDFRHRVYCCTSLHIIIIIIKAEKKSNFLTRIIYLAIARGNFFSLRRNGEGITKFRFSKAYTATHTV